MTATRSYAEWIPEREFIGYGYNTPDPKWPAGAKVAVVFAINYNIGAESSPVNGDKYVETSLLEIGHTVNDPDRFEMVEGQYEYGGRNGVPRLLSLFKKYNIKTTWNISTHAFTLAPYWAKKLAESGHELSCASKRYIDYFEMDPKEEETHIKEAIETLQSTTGDKTIPKGWCIDRRSNTSQRLYTRAHNDISLPLLYSSDSSADDLPFWLPSPLKDDGLKDEGLLIVPFHHECGDMRFNVTGGGFGGPMDFLTMMTEAFDVLYEEGEEGEPKMMTVTLHPHIIGRGSRCYYLEEFIKYIKSKPDVWITTREEVATHWRNTYPYDPKTAFGQTPAPPATPAPYK
ncbi:glycoside hydrolase/deacetylase [Meredithblackwellia eburnea MCA 4105]